MHFVLSLSTSVPCTPCLPLSRGICRAFGLDEKLLQLENEQNKRKTRTGIVSSPLAAFRLRSYSAVSVFLFSRSEYNSCMSSVIFQDESLSVLIFSDI